ncbi:indolepyruvate ferredoxin oxidoreductase family protein [Nonomuraea sp. CA-218870]|uniref:indolepyruvate ferredoxin oxidoreductase family protein n=1 Tax=Nonomuraea sp. CA-218870 TaxID=3239998 RepID=UPI003D8FDEDF
MTERVRLEDRYEATAGRVQLTGVQALARLPIDQHRRDLARGRRVATFVSGYEGSPLGGYDLELHRQRRLLEANDVVFRPGLNEESAATAVQGSQLANTLDGARYDGVLGIWYGKAPGLDRATDALRHGNLMGAHPGGGAIVLVGDDPAAKSSSVPCASESALADLAMPFLYPADSQDVLELGLHAVELSRATGLWAGLKIVTAVADGSSTVFLDDERPEPLLPPGAGRHRPTARLLQPTLGPLERDLVTNRLRLAVDYARLNRLNRVVGAAPGDRLGVIAAGRTYLDVVESLRRLGVDEPDLEASGLRLLRVAMPFPLEAETVREFADGLTEIVVVEEKRSFLETAVRDILYGGPATPLVTGKRDARGDELFPAYGELDVDAIVPRLRRRLLTNGIPVTPEPRQAGPEAGRRLPLLRRAPYFCSGCPHNTSTKTLDGSLVGGGIGCHAMVVLMDEAQVGSVTGLSQMGGEGLQWVGMAPFVEREHYVQNLGDGTFDHSGSLAIRAAVAAGVDITYKLLYNSAVAMTGGQATVGGMGVTRIVDVLLAEGVSKIIITTEDLRRYRRTRLPRGVKVWGRSRIEEAQRILAGTPGVTVLLHDQECATETRRKRKRGLAPRPATRVFINERVCEGCGDCGRKSNCLSVQPVATGYGRKTRIHQASCNLDTSCLDGDCPAFMTVSAAPVTRRTDPVDAADLPEPEAVTGADAFGVRVLGIGGTGVVTVSQVLATAGLVAGWNARSLDQTGLAQKGGAVVSDVKFSRDRRLTSNRLAEGECDLYLGCDILVAADAGNLTVASPERTVAVLSTSEVPTGRMVADPAVAFPALDEVTAPILDRVRPGPVRLLDARALASELFGDDQTANMLLVGVAFQLGAIPLPAEAIEEAIRLNGVAVEVNLQAFRHGRRFARDPAAPRAQAAPPPREDVTGTVRAAPGSELARLVALRSHELVAYQDLGYARRYTGVVERVRALEESRVPGSTAFAESVARHLFKLMAYKDEYEVARLSLGDDVRSALTEQFGPGARASWKLHPPLLRAVGLRRKLTLGPWFRPALVALRASRRLRGTAFDPFGHMKVRRVERALVREYTDLVEHLAGRLTAANVDLAVQLADLPDLVRGYEDVKLRTIEKYHAELSALRARFDAQ